MSLRDRLISFRCVMLRYNPIRHQICLIKVGNPDSSSPVFVSGNYFHSVKRLERALSGLDCYILVACSAGINAWCAAGVCDFNEHKIADAVHATGLADIVEHRELVLPQLAAVGIDLKKLRSESGFKGIWGPASMFDIPAYLDAGKKADSSMRIARFPLSDRLYNAVGMFNIFLLLPIIAFFIWGVKGAHLFLILNFINIYGAFVLYDILPFKYPCNNCLIIGFLTMVYILVDGLHWHQLPMSTIGFRLGAAAFVNFLVAIDMLGSTPFYKTTIAHWLTTLDNKSLFQPEVNDSCVGCRRCLEVCPKGIFSMEEKKAKVDLYKECCECLACVKQCPVTAIVNMNGEIHKDDIKSVHHLDEVMRPRPEGKS